jgi:Flp pilus assembly protein TadD
MIARCVFLAMLTCTTPACRGSDVATREAREGAYRENNRGVAALERYAYDEAVQAFRRAIVLDPRVDLPHVNLAIALFFASDFDGAGRAAIEAERRQPDSPQASYVRGLVARAQNDVTAARAAFERVRTRDPDDVGTLVNLGQMAMQERRAGDAVALLREAVRLEPFNGTALYALGQALTRDGSTEEGARVIARFERFRESGAAVTYSQTYLEQGRYAEALASTGAEPDLVDATTPPIRFSDATAEWAPSAGLPSPTGGPRELALTDLDGDGDLDLVVSDAARVTVLRWNGTRFEPAPAPSAGVGLGAVRGVVAADADNDERADLLLLHEGGVALHRQGTSGAFTALGPPFAVEARLRTAALLDADHDGDLDVIAAGRERAAERGLVVLLQNDGTGQLRDVTTGSGLRASGDPSALVATDFDGGRDIDVLVLDEQERPTLFANQRDGSFRDAAAETGIDDLASGEGMAAGDFNKDGRPDVFVVGGPGPARVASSRGRREYVVSAGPPASAGLSRAQAADYDNDGLIDIVGAGDRGLTILRSVGTGFVDTTRAAFGGTSGVAAAIAALAVGDVDEDGDLDIVAAAPDGRLHWLRSDGAAARSLPVRLQGTVSNRSGVGAKVDVRAGSLGQRIEVFAAAPPVATMDLRFGIGTRAAADVVRVLWPAGIVQAETSLPASSRDRLLVTELNRKPSSCPYLYSWNGDTFEFATDFLGGAEMGYWTGPSGWNTPDPDEMVRLTDQQLVSRDGRFELRVTNELEEVLYVDRLRLLSVHHSGDLEVHPREGMKTAPSNGVPLVAVRDPRPVSHVRTDDGDDVSALVARPDGRSIGPRRALAVRGYAEPHALTFTIGDTRGNDTDAASRRVLLLTGWTDYAMSSDNVAATQRGWALEPPQLETRAANGEWRLVTADVGVPVGRPQTIVVDLPDTRTMRSPLTFRLRTNMRIHWDALAVARVADDVNVEPQEHTLVDATLRWRGFSVERPHGDDLRPVYADVVPTSPWKVLSGPYTHEGDVGPLLTGTDDLFVVARSGDEIALAFNAPTRPTRPTGPTSPTRPRTTYFLHAVGYSKEMDVRSASPDHVLPLPYRGMKRYPPPPASDDVSARQREMLDRWNTRKITRQLPPLVNIPSR